MNIRDMHFDNRRCYRGDSVAKCNRGMRIAAWIKDDAIMIKAHSLYLIDQFAFDISLKKRKMDVRKLCPQLFQENFERHIAVDICFSFTKEIKVGAVDDGDLHFTNIEITVQSGVRSLESVARPPELVEGRKAESYYSLFYILINYEKYSLYNRVCAFDWIIKCATGIYGRACKS